MIKPVTYELFLPAATAAFRDKAKGDGTVSDGEFKMLVALAFRDAVYKLMSDAFLYRIEIPIDIYAGVQRYDIIPPEPYIVVDVSSLREHKTTIPPHSYDNKNLFLLCCPAEDVNTAFFIEAAVAIRPTSATCEVDPDFVDRHYALIKNAMFWDLARMAERKWASLGVVDRYKRAYDTALYKAKRDLLNGGKLVSLSTRRMSSRAAPGQRPNCNRGCT